MNVNTNKNNISDEKENKTMSNFNEKAELANALTVIAKAITNGTLDIRAISGAMPEIGAKSKVQKTTSLTKKKAHTKCFSVAIVREIERAIEGGMTSEELENEFGISYQTIRRYIKDHHTKYPGYYKKYMEKVRMNNKASKASTKYDAEVEENVSVPESADLPVIVELPESADFPEIVDLPEKEIINTEEAAQVTGSENFVEVHKTYVIDGNILRAWQNRLKWTILIEKLKSENAHIIVHSRSKLEKIAESHNVADARNLAADILNDSSLTVVDTALHIQWTAVDYEATVISHNLSQEEYCRKAGVDFMTVDAYLASTPKAAEPEEEYVEKGIDPNDAEAVQWAKKLTVPLKLNNNNRAICTISALKSYAEKVYGGCNCEVKVTTANGKERITPNDKLLRIQAGDVVIVHGDMFEAEWKILTESLSENAYERSYVGTSTKTATKTA